MDRDLNKICKRCVFFESGKCHFQPPGHVNFQEIKLKFPETVVELPEGKILRIKHYEPIVMSLTEGQVWPFVGCDDWCSHFSNQ
jgi:hypothetical protein